MNRNKCSSRYENLKFCTAAESPSLCTPPMPLSAAECLAECTHEITSFELQMTKKEKMPGVFQSVHLAGTQRAYGEHSADTWWILSRPTLSVDLVMYHESMALI